MANIKTVNSKSQPAARKILDELLEKEALELTFAKIDEFCSKKAPVDEGDSQSVSLMLFLELRKNKMSRGWVWVRGIKKITEEKSIFHSWLEYEGYVIDPLPAFVISGEKYVPGDIIIVKKEKYREVSGFKPMSLKSEKQVLRWIEKISGRYS